MEIHPWSKGQKTNSLSYSNIRHTHPAHGYEGRPTALSSDSGNMFGRVMTGFLQLGISFPSLLHSTCDFGVPPSCVWHDAVTSDMTYASLPRTFQMRLTTTSHITHMHGHVIRVEASCCTHTRDTAISGANFSQHNLYSNKKHKTASPTLPTLSLNPSPTIRISFSFRKPRVDPPKTSDESRIMSYCTHFQFVSLHPVCNKSPCNYLIICVGVDRYIKGHVYAVGRGGQWSGSWASRPGTSGDW